MNTTKSCRSRRRKQNSTMVTRSCRTKCHSRWHSPNSLLLTWMTTFLSLLLLRITHQVVHAHPPPPQANDVFGTVTGCASALIEMDDNQDGMIKKGEYLDFVNLLADFLCVPPRPIMDLEIQTVFFSIACLCQEREGFSIDCCFGNDAAIYTDGAADGLTRTEDQDSYLRAACLLTQAILGPQQCTLAPQTLSPAAVTLSVSSFAVTTSDGGLSDDALIGIIVGAILLALLCCILLLCTCCKKKKEEDEEEMIVKQEEIIEEANVKPVDEESPPEPPMKEEEEPPLEGPMAESRSMPVPPPPVPEPAPAPPSQGPGSPGWSPAVLPVPATRSAPVEEEDVEEEENIGRRSGATINDDEEEESTRKFSGQGMLPQQPAPEGVVLRHIEVEKQEPGDYIYPEREFYEEKDKPDDDSVQEFEPYIADSGVNIPERPTKAPVVYNPKWTPTKKEVKEPFDARKLRKQLGLGDGEVWGALAAHEEKRKSTKENKFEWIVQGALDVLAKAHESGELTKPRPPRAVSPQHMRTSDTPPPRPSSRHNQGQTAWA